MRVRSTREKKREWGEGEREKKSQILNVRATITVHICTVIVALVHLCTILHPLMWVFFFIKMCKMNYFFYFARFCNHWCGCSKLLLAFFALSYFWNKTSLYTSLEINSLNFSYISFLGVNFENLTVEFHVPFAPNMHIKFCSNWMLFTIRSINLFFIHNLRS